MRLNVLPWLAAALGWALIASACGGSAAAPAPVIDLLPGATATRVAPTAPRATPVATATVAAATAAASPGPSTATPATPAPTPTAAAAGGPAATNPTPPTASPAAVAIEVHANNLAFDLSEIKVPAGVAVTAVFRNDDSGVDHNLSFGLPGFDHPTCKGPCTTTQRFTAPAPGRYSFFCNIHGSMFGDFVVDP